MALYLGNTKVTPALTNTVTRTITQNAGGTVISDVTTAPYTTYEDPDNLPENLPVVTHWIRPAAWPNLEALPALTEGIYLTYDNRSTVDYKWASFYCGMNTGKVRIAQGHVSGTSWVQDTYWDVASSTYKEIDYSSSTYDFVVFKITPASTNHIQQFYFARVAAATLGTYALRQQQDQYCLERVGKLPYLTTTAGSGENYRYCCEWMEHDKVSFGDTVTSLSCAWYRGRRLQKLEFDGWTGENCNITTLASCFEQCNEIEELDLSAWKTHNWHITTLNSMFYCCFRLKTLNVTWDTVNWGATSNRAITMSSMFSYCTALESLDLTSWDVSGWNCTTLASTWAYCNHLKKLKVNTWNTSNWHVTALNSTWEQCFLLNNVDLSSWDTTNWTITSLGYTFRSNWKRRNFDDIKYWVTTNWRPTTMISMFEQCYSVQEIDLSRWDVSEWPCTSLSATWSNCRSMRSLKVGTWDMTKTNKWKVTDIYSMLNQCHNLEDSTFFNWTPSNWAVIRVGSTFYACYKLKEIDLTNWSAATFTIKNDSTHINYFAGYCHSARKIDISPLNLTNVTTLNYYGSNNTTYTNFYECQNLEKLILPATFKGHLNLRYNYLMSRDEIVRIFNALPTAISGAKIVLTEMRYKLTTADIAIATNKGYTVS